MNGLLKTSANFLIHKYFLTSSSHACCFCLFSDNKWPIFVERQILFLIIKLCAVKMLLRAGFEPATYGFQQWSINFFSSGSCNQNWASMEIVHSYRCNITTWVHWEWRAFVLLDRDSTEPYWADRGNGPSGTIQRQTDIHFLWVSCT